VNRYDLRMSYGYAQMAAAENGEYMRYDDHEAALAEECARTDEQRAMCNAAIAEARTLRRAVERLTSERDTALRAYIATLPEVNP
jgi:hypothetical protein